MKDEIKLERARKKAAEAARLLGIEIDVEEVNLHIDPETQSDKMAEAQSVLNFYLSRGHGFKQIECNNCGLIFAYAWDRDSIKYCSIHCMKKALEKIGLKWNPNKPPAERWGRTVPAVVPPKPLELIEEKLKFDEFESLNDLHPDKLLQESDEQI